MERRKIIRLMGSTAVLALMPAMAGCVTERTVYRQAPPPQYQPPVDYRYYYYPEVAVYFHIATGFYWYFIHGHWRRARRLPQHIHLRGPRYTFVIRDEYPYQHYHDHRRRYGNPHEGYGPGKDWHYDRDDRGRGDDDDRGNGRGRGDDDRGNGHGRGGDDDQNGNRGNGRDRLRDNYQNGNRGNLGNGGRNGNGGQQWDQDDSNRNRNNGKGADNPGRRKRGDDNQDNAPAADHDDRPMQNDKTLREKVQEKLQQQQQQPLLQKDRQLVKPGKDNDQRGAIQNGGKGNGNKEGGDEELPWIKKPKPDDQ